MAAQKNVKSSTSPRARPVISSSSLVYVPEDVVEGFEKRINTGISWTLVEKATIYHKERFCEDMKIVTFSEAYNEKIQKSIIGKFLEEESNMTFEDKIDIILSLSLWHIEKFANEEEKICFQCSNSMIDNYEKALRDAARKPDSVQYLKDALADTSTLRVMDCMITNLDVSLLTFKNLTMLNLCGNCITGLDMMYFPPCLKYLELQANYIKSLETFGQFLPPELIYLGLSRNLLDDESVKTIHELPDSLASLDLSHNDIYNLTEVLESVRELNLSALQLVGNPCTVCMAYFRFVMITLPELEFLDDAPLPKHGTTSTYNLEEPHPDDLRSNYFNFTMSYVYSAPSPPKVAKGIVSTFYIELELPFLDSMRRQFLMFNDNEDLVKQLPPPEDDTSKVSMNITSRKSVKSMKSVSEHASSVDSVYMGLSKKNSRIMLNYTVLESIRLPWAPVISFPSPTVRIFCPDLKGLRDTMRTEVTIKLMYSVVYPTPKGGAANAKKAPVPSDQPTGEYQVVIATIKCPLRQISWYEKELIYEWNDNMPNDVAVLKPIEESKSTQDIRMESSIKNLRSNNKSSKMSKLKIEENASFTIPENLSFVFNFKIDQV